MALNGYLELMYYRLSNTTDRRSMEREMGIPFKYPNLYQPKLVINGLKETIVPVVTNSEPNHITYAIWGILPEQYNEDWKQFQNVLNTLTIRQDSLGSDMWYSHALRQRRCLMLVSGYYTFRLRHGELLPFYVSAACGGILSLGGVYNQLEDGFITCALLVVNADTTVRRVQNIDDGMPLIISPSMRETWLYPSPDRDKIYNLVRQPPKVKLRATPVSMDRTKNEKFLQISKESRDFPDFPFNK